MVIIRQSLEEIRAAKLGRPKLMQASECDVARAMAEDHEAAPEVTLDSLIAPKNLRRRLNMTQ